MEDSEAFRAAVRAHTAVILNGKSSPYDAALEIWALAGRQWPGDDGDEACVSLQLVWGALTDWVELRPAETDQAETRMVAAAREWLTIEGDREAEVRYFDRWIYDILGYEHPALPQA
ncbi:hypothetical protein [Streptomyces sp. NBC_01497]|uniref:hypothetical protein n=1 Tax=Streptomyces sp. NBC_01497 TaxID=2903885 RepID=UPI002E31F08C|nr:hypothetical protein [Streptomyces sp. NBC_01497]